MTRGAAAVVAMAATTAALSGCDWPSQADAAPEATGSSRVDILDALDGLEVADEHPTGYDRDDWSGWRDPDGNGCDTRQEVLIAEDTSHTLSAADCDTDMSGGRWTSIYDGRNVTDPGDLDIDHVVPLAEAWASGAHTWDDERRDDYATHTDDPDHLVAVTNTTNRSKGDKDPARWMPPDTTATCDYLATWVTIKTTWGLSVDAAERDAITDLAEQCPTEEKGGDTS